MATVTRLRPTIETSQRRADPQLGEAPKAPDQWLTRLRNKYPPRKVIAFNAVSAKRVAPEYPEVPSEIQRSVAVVQAPLEPPQAVPNNIEESPAQESDSPSVSQNASENVSAPVGDVSAVPESPVIKESDKQADQTGLDGDGRNSDVASSSTATTLRVRAPSNADVASSQLFPVHELTASSIAESQELNFTPVSKTSQKSNVDIEHQYEQTLFDCTVGPWMQGIIRHSVKGLGYGVRIRIELEHVPERVSKRRHFTIVIVCCGLKTRKIKEIENIFSKPGRSSGLQGFSWIIREGTTFGFRGSQTPFSNTAIWEVQRDPPVEIALPQNSATLCGAPIQVDIARGGPQPASVSWTCGGLIRVNDDLFGLTTAHPFVVQPPDVSPEKAEDDDEDDGKFSDDDIAPDPFFWQSWQTAGRVQRFALSQTNVVPDNCDWLLFNVERQYQLPNRIRGPPLAKAYSATPSWVQMPSANQGSAKAQSKCAIYTSHGIVRASVRTGSSFLIMGDSAFKAINLEVNKNLKLGDSGAWVVGANKVIGIVIAGDEDSKSAFAIDIEDVFKSISKGLNDADVRLLSRVDNRILARRTGLPDGDLEDLLHSCFLEAVQAEATPRDHEQFGRDSNEFRKRSLEAKGQTCRPELSGYLAIGMLFQTPVEQLQKTLYRHRYNPLFPMNKSHRLIGKLGKVKYGQYFLSFIAWFALTCVRDLKLTDRLDYITVLVEELINNLSLAPTSAPSTLEIRSLLNQIAFGWPLSLRLYLMLFRHTPQFPLRVGTPKSIPEPRLGAKLLTRLMTFDRDRYFFLYRGPHVDWLSQFIRPGDIIWRGKPGQRIRASIRQVPKNLPRVILMHGTPQDQRDDNCGKVIVHPGLEELLLSLSQAEINGYLRKSEVDEETRAKKPLPESKGKEAVRPSDKKG